MPVEYRLELLARRWGIAVYDLVARLDEPEVQLWVQRGFLFMTMEAQASEVRRG